MSTTQSERLRELLEPLVSSKDLDLEEIEVASVGRKRVLRVVIDSDEGVDLDEIAEVSRELSAKLDEHDVMGEGEYTLEVGSPGAERPLKEHRHFVRATDRLARFWLTPEAGGGELVARILKVDDEGLDLEVPGVKGRKPTSRRLAFTDIAKARVEIEFSRKSTSAEGTQNTKNSKNIKNIENAEEA
ncbi:ribosome maturation factor RimP [Streptomyces jeddahensis]|uniref:Ribosome maturation factor RimP n=1 Tax=Streptomyces jeddahensis TaxID=1716141 RepID=A0A177HI19_9ACTN|nr:ribosome maturation factor RimP [Streptomyces jeddahensis]OAH10027.1 ribosome maturation factor RimP [Streptomyces jeddahensis]